MSVLTKQEHVMSHAHANDDYAFFTQESEPRLWTITREDWEDMGKPLTITITVQPGDLLN